MTDQTPSRRARDIIARVGATITSSLELDDVLSAVARQCGEALGSYSCDIHYYSAAEDRLTFVANWECDNQAPPSVLSHLLHSFSPMEWPSLARIVRTREVVEVHIDDDDLPDLERQQMQRWGEKTTLDAALIHGDEVIGVLGLTETRIRHFSEEERELFGELAVLAAIAIWSAITIRHLEELTRFLTSLLEASDALVNGSADDALDLMARETAKALRTEVCVVHEYDKIGDCLVTRALYAASADRAPVTVGEVLPLRCNEDDRSVMAANEPVVRTASDQSLTLATRESLANLEAKTVLKIPLAVDGAVIGLMLLFAVDVERRFTKGELELARAVGRQIAAKLAVSRTRLEQMSG